MYSNINLIGNNIFKKNSGEIGGGIYAKASTLSITATIRITLGNTVETAICACQFSSKIQQ